MYCTTSLFKLAWIVRQVSILYSIFLHCIRLDSQELELEPSSPSVRTFARASSFVDLRTFDEFVWSATYPSETDV